MESSAKFGNFMLIMFQCQFSQPDSHMHPWNIKGDGSEKEVDQFRLKGRGT